MAAPSVSINVMLAIQEKKTNAVDLLRPLRNYIAEHYSNRDVADNEEDLETVQQMRNEVEKMSDSLDSRRDLLQRYFKCLCMMESRFPISNEKEHVNSITFTWFDAFKPGKKASNQNIHLEKASIVFNLGAVQSQIALAADRVTPTGIKQACNCFQASAGAFAFLRDNISMKASGGSSTVDISVECAGMLERLMLAQAQECFFEKAVSDKKPSSLCAKIARQVGLFYEEAHAALLNPPLSQHFDKAWVSHVQLKAAQYQGEACYRLALDLHEKEEIAEEIARLSAASSLLSTAKKSGRGVVSQLIDAISKLEANVNHNLEQAKKENDRVYLVRVPVLESLPPLPAVALVKPLNMADILDASKEKMFYGLVPDSSAKALSRYTEMLDDIIRAQAEKLQQESEVAKARLKEMDLPDMLYALDGTAIIPDHLRDDIEAVQLDGGPPTLEAEMRRLEDLRRVNQELLRHCEEKLQNESREDAQLRAQFGTRWTRPQSSTLAKTLQDSINNYNSKIKQAADVDTRIDRMIRDNWETMSILSVKPIESAYPTIGRPIMSLNGDEDAVVGALKQSLGHLEMLGSQRAGLEDMLKEMKQQDNILPKLMTTSGSYEDLFKKELGKYDQICQEIQKNVDAQERILQQIKMQNDSFISIFNLEDFKASSERTSSRIRAAISKYREIRDNINNAGIKFYVTLQDAINNLKQQCDDFVLTREIQGRDMVEDLQRQVSTLSMNSGSNQPPKESGGLFSLLPFITSRLGSNPPRDVPTSGGNQIPQPPYPSHEASAQHTGHSTQGQPQHQYYSPPISNASQQQHPGPQPPYYYQPRPTPNGQTLLGSVPTYYTQPGPVSSQPRPQTSPYFADQGPRQGQQSATPQAGYYSQGVPNPVPNPNPNQHTYPGWQGPYYNQHSTQSAYNAPHYPPSTR